MQPVPGEVRLGSCAGQVAGADHTGGRWFQSINGQTFPSVNVPSSTGEIWKLTNASGSFSYDLHLQDAATKADIPFQVISIDGVSFNGDTTAPIDAMQKVMSSKMKAITCPIAVRSPLAPLTSSQPVCATSVRMMPSSRVEIRVSYRNAGGFVTNAPAGAKAVLRTIGFSTGGDNWPAVDLAEVTFTNTVVNPGLALLGAKPTLIEAARVKGEVLALSVAGGIYVTPAVFSGPQPSAANCKPSLAPGHKRRIYYGVPIPGQDGFGLGYEEIDQNGVPVPGTFVDVSVFDPVTPIVCLPLGFANMPAKETWELVNVSAEDHNFHIHQTKFRIVDAAAKSASPLFVNPSLVPATYPLGAVLHDNLPLPNADQGLGVCDGSVAKWKSNACPAKPIAIEMIFAEAGDFVYHCHILEHEDGGMMAKIRVRRTL